jgi:hypothetical protein
MSIRGLRVEKIAQIETLGVGDLHARFEDRSVLVSSPSYTSNTSYRKLLEFHTQNWVERVYRDQQIWRREADVLYILRRDEEIGFVPLDTDLGDVICIFLGFRVPFILRPINSAWQLVGECYLPWLMEGQQVAHIDWHEAYNKTPPTPLEDFYIY